MYDYRDGDIVRRVGISKHICWVRGFCSHIYRPVNSFFQFYIVGFCICSCMYIDVRLCVWFVCMFVCACGWVGVLVCVVHLCMCMCICWEVGELVGECVCARACVCRGVFHLLLAGKWEIFIHQISSSTGHVSFFLDLINRLGFWLVTVFYSNLYFNWFS